MSFLLGAVTGIVLSALVYIYLRSQWVKYTDKLKRELVKRDIPVPAEADDFNV